MKREYYYKDSDLHLIENIPENYAIKDHVEDSLTEYDGKTNGNNTSGIFRNLKIDGISIDIIDKRHKSPIKMDVKQDTEHLEICFELEGHKHYAPKDGNYLNTLNGRYSFFYFKNLDGELTFYPEEGKHKCVEIELSIPFLKRLLNNDLSILGDFGEKIQKRENAVFINNATISLQMRYILKQIIDPPQKLSGVLRKVSTESHIIDLILLVVLQAKERSQKIAKNSILSQDDINKIYKAREIIIEKIDAPCSLLELARLSGINDFKLKKGFKEIFGTTVFKYLFDERMERSKSLILEGKLTISEITFMIGYKNPAHFSAAFKRKFGYLPSDLRRIS